MWPQRNSGLSPSLSDTSSPGPIGPPPVTPSTPTQVMGPGAGPGPSQPPPPEFHPPLRPNYGRLGRPIVLRANHFQVSALFCVRGLGGLGSLRVWVPGKGGRAIVVVECSCPQDAVP